MIENETEYIQSIYGNSFNAFKFYRELYPTYPNIIIYYDFILILRVYHR